MKKAFDQTVRDLKREVNKKVLKVPSIEQKVLDATSNEPWGPHGSLLADIAQASRNYHEYQMIMSIIWKRINDTGKNWRHVYKALTVLDYLVAHGSERVIDEIREHAYQISTLSDFQYIDSSGRDQGNNVRKKSQTLVVLVNDKERIQEVRQKAAANRDKYRNTSMGNMYRPGSNSSGGGYDRYDEDRYGSRDDDRNGYGREREWGQQDDDRYGRYGDSYGRDGDRYNREYEEHSSRGGYRDDEYRGRSRSIDNYQYGSRSRSADRDRERTYEDDGQYSSSGAKADDHSQEGSTTSRPIDRKYSEQNLSLPPSYEEAVNGSRSPTSSERDGESSRASMPKASSPPPSASPSNAAPAASPTPLASASPPAPTPATKKNDSFDEFDPRGSAVPTTSNAAASTKSGGTEMDLLDSLALVPVTQPTTSEVDASVNSVHGPAFVPTSSQSFDDPFGDGPFKAVTSANNVPAQPPTVSSTSSFQQSFSESSGLQQPIPQNTTTDFGGTQSSQQGSSTHNQELDILADILPPSGPPLPVNSQTGYPVQAGQPALQPGFASQPGQFSPQTSYPLQPGQTVSMATTFPGQPGQPSQMGFPAQGGQSPAVAGFPSQMGSSQAGIQSPPVGQSTGSNSFYGGQFSTTHGSQTHLPSSTMSTAIVPQPSKDKFETKSSVWADTLNRGLVNLNISGSKTNPLADIGVDFEAINRKERRMEKPTASPAISNVAMGKAMGSGSGIGRAGAGAIRPPPSNQMMGSGMGMGAPNRPALGMGGYGVNQGMQHPMGMGMGMSGNMGMGMGQGVHMQQQTGFPPVTRPRYNYNPTMGSGNFSQRPYGGGY